MITFSLPGWEWTTFILVEQALVILAIVLVLRRRGEPRSMLAWILTLQLVPVIGLVLFVLFGEPRREWHRMRRRRRRRHIVRALARERRNVAETENRASIADSAVRNLTRTASRLAGYPPTRGNRVKIYNDSEPTYAALIESIESAERYIHLEYYIFEADDTGTSVRDALLRKVQQGVECRVLLDYIGSWRLSRRFLQPLRDAGGRVEFCLPFTLSRGRWRVNFRNHRKIAVIDSRVAFTGSQNIGDVYRGRLARCSPWQDMVLGIQGPAVHHYQEVFAQDWHYTTKEDLFNDRYFPDQEEVGDHIIQIVPSGPDQRTKVMHQILFAAANMARSSLTVITPYFVPDRAMVIAFQSASYRGVRVRLLIPTRTDEKIVLWAGRSFYEDLLGAGVEIYEIDTVMLHSKVMIVDDSWSMVGSANMDERSFSLNFELTNLLYSRDLIEDLRGTFDGLCKGARKLSLSDTTNPPFGRSLLLGAARLASPIL